MISMIVTVRLWRHSNIVRIRPDLYILAGLAMKSLISIFLQIDDAVDHIRHVTWSTIMTPSSSSSRRRNSISSSDIASCQRRRRHEHFPEINRLEKHQRFIEF